VSGVDPFFKLPGSPSELTTEEFYQHMDRSNHLCDSIYRPESLERRDSRATKLVAKTFERVSFSKTEIRNIIFTDCTFRECLFIGSTIKNCEFHNCRFESTNTYKIAFINTYVDPLSFKTCLDKDKYQNIGVQLFQNLMNNSRDSEQPEFEADAHFLFLRWKRYQELYEVRRVWEKQKKLLVKKRARILARFIWEWLFGSGIRIRHYAVTVFGCVLLISIANYLFRNQLGLSDGSATIVSIADSFYFSTVTLTTLGFGDIAPDTQLGRLVVAGESVLGFFLFATLASMLFRKIVP
jgi:hypothetical protein